MRKLIVVLAALLAACSQSGERNSDWVFHGLAPDETRYSSLAQINKETVTRLGLAWSLELPDESGGLEATPLEVDGVLYFSGSMAKVYAVAVDSGKLLWSFDPRTGQAIPNERRITLPVNRGVAYSNGAVYVATRDGRMISIDARTGNANWITQFLLPDSSSSTGAPRVCGSNVLIGNAGSESLSRGYVTAMNLKTGKVSWRFFIVPGNPAADRDETTRIAAKTWSGEWWKYGGGGNPWGGMTCDEELGQFLIGTGNGAPATLSLRANGIQDNLFVASLVAVDIETGRYKWHYQYNPGEEWDWKATTDIALTEMELGGKRHKVALQAPSNGFFYVIDRTNGKLLSAKDYGKQNWAKYIDLKSGRPVETGLARYGKKLAPVFPGFTGAHNWQAMAVNPEKQLAFIPYMQTGASYATSDAEVEKVKVRRHAGFVPSGITGDVAPPTGDPLDDRGSLIAWDIARQKIAWRVDYPSRWNGGVLATKAGLVFQGLEDGHLVAYDDATGKRLWSFDSGLGIIAPPITYSRNGRQYVSVLVGYGGAGGTSLGPSRKTSWLYREQPRRLLTFALDGAARLPATVRRTRVDTTPPLSVPGLKLDGGKVALGGEIYNYSCSYCHFVAGMGAGSAPDLRTSSIAADPAAFRQVLREGILVDRGMPQFGDLSPEEVEGLYQYIRHVSKPQSEVKRNIRPQ